MVKTKIELWESKEQKKVDVMVDANEKSWIAKSDFDNLFARYKSLVAMHFLLMFGILVLALSMMW